MSRSRKEQLSQYLTPVWAAEALVERHFPNLSAKDFVIEPSVGGGAFLQAIPSSVPAIGIDICPSMVELARSNTKREIILGDYASVPLDVSPTTILGNPPFKTTTIDAFLARSHDLLPEGGQVGFILPAYALQTAKRVSGYADKWSMFQEMIPRNIFEGLQCPLVFAVFTKDRYRKLVGFALYHEMSDLQGLPKEFRTTLSEGSGSVWVNAVKMAILKLGGEAELADIYAKIEGSRPTKTDHWREQIRKVVRMRQDVFESTGPARYAVIDEPSTPSSSM